MLYSAVIGVCLGVALTLLGVSGLLAAVFFLFTGAAFLVLGSTQKRKLFFILAVGCTTLVLGVVRTEFFLQKENKVSLAVYVGGDALLEGVVVNDPEYRATSLHATIAVEKINGELVQGKALAILPRVTSLAYGDHVEVSGTIALPQSFVTDTGREFDYASYLRVQGVSALISRAELTARVEGGASVQKMLYIGKHFFESSLERLLPEPDVSLMEGVLIGERRGMPKDLNDAFIVSGLVHMVVLSGYNIGVVSESILRGLALILPRTLALGSGAVGIVLFALMAGAGATTVRACLMGLIAILARYLDRPTLAMRSLAVAGVGMVMWNPPTLLHDPSFVLSMLATFGLVALSGAVEKKLLWVPEMFGIRSVAASTVAVQLFVLPALLYYSGVLSLVALPANMLALPLVPVTMLLGFLAGVAGLISNVLAFPFVLGSEIFLKWLLLVATTAASLPLASAIIPTFPAWIMVLFYIPLTALALRIYSR